MTAARFIWQLPGWLISLPLFALGTLLTVVAILCFALASLVVPAGGTQQWIRETDLSHDHD